MSNEQKAQERREFFRYKHENPIKYKVIDSTAAKNPMSQFINAISKNLSASGILFAGNNPPHLSEVLILDLDFRTTQVCTEIEENALILNNKLFGKVVRIEETDDGSYDIGVAFIKKDDYLPEEIKNLVKNF